MINRCIYIGCNLAVLKDFIIMQFPISGYVLILKRKQLSRKKNGIIHFHIGFPVSFMLNLFFNLLLLFLLLLF